MEVMNCTVRRQELNVDVPTLVALSYDYINVTATFSSEWEGMQKWLHIRNVADQTLVGHILFENDEIGEDKGLNLSAGEWDVWIHGAKYEDNALIKRITTNVKRIKVEATGSEDEILPDVGPSVAEQAVAAAERAETAADNAETSADNAQTAADNAENYAEQAGMYEQDCALHAAAAQTAEHNAQEHAESASESANSAQTYAQQAANAVLKYPRIDETTKMWLVWSAETNQWVDTGVKAEGGTFTPSVDSYGNLSWTNNVGLPNPPTVNLVSLFNNVPELQARMDEILAEAETGVADIEEQRDTILASIAAAAELGTDTTLTTAGMAADANATGNAVSHVKYVLSQALVRFAEPSYSLEQGGINASGVEQENTTRVRTATYIPIDGNMIINVTNGVRWATRLYGASDNYLAYYPTDGLWVSSSGFIDVAALKAANANATKIRFIFSYANGDITPAEVAASVNIAYYRAFDGSLTTDAKAAEASAVGDNLKGARNIINKFMLGDEVTMTWQNGQRGSSSGGSSGVIGTGVYFSCSNLVDVAPGEIFTLVNLRPDKYRFAVRAYTDTPENSGVYISGVSAAKFLKDNLELTGSSATVYSTTTEWVYKNTLTILQNVQASTAKYWSVHARRVSSDSTEGRYRPEDLAELQEAFHLYKGAPFLKADFCYPVMQLKVLVTGDSICRGGRNGSRGFVGDVGCAYVNIGIGGASLSNVVDSTDSTDTPHVMGATNIPDTLVKYAEQSSQSWYIEPDAIIAEGGINDYFRNAPLGSVPTAPARNDTDAATLDLTTVTGGLGYLCYQMVKLYPNAHRFFLLMNRVTNKPWTANTAGYTQTQMNDAITAVCKLYSVDVIDVFNQSLIASTFSEYVSPTAYRDDPSITDLYYIDSDMIHPLALGYKTGYAPLVREALRKAVNG